MLAQGYQSSGTGLKPCENTFAACHLGSSPWAHEQRSMVSRIFLQTDTPKHSVLKNMRVTALSNFGSSADGACRKQQGSLAQFWACVVWRKVLEALGANSKQADGLTVLGAWKVYVRSQGFLARLRSTVHPCTCSFEPKQHPTTYTCTPIVNPNDLQMPRWLKSTQYELALSGAA